MKKKVSDYLLAILILLMVASALINVIDKESTKTIEFIIFGLSSFILVVYITLLIIRKKVKTVDLKVKEH